MKVCKKCGVEKSLDEFYNDKRLSDGKRTRCKKCCNEQRIEYWHNNYEVQSERVKKYQAENRERRNARDRAYRKANPESEMNKGAKRRGLKNNARLPNGYWSAMLTFYQGQCAKCGSQDRLTLDHVIPLTWGGEHSLRNAQILCHSCNSSKCARNDDDYRGVEILVDVNNGVCVTETRKYILNSR